MFAILKRWRRERILDRHRIRDAVWQSIIGQVRSASHLPAADIERLRDLASLFLYEKALEPAQGIGITAAMRARIGCEAAVPILNLGLDYYRTFYSVILYEEAFFSRDAYQDEDGVLHTEPDARAGEAWPQGPVIISWADIENPTPGYNVIIHEMAHKLDMLDGYANGRPPLHRGMDPREWTAAFSEAFASHTSLVEAGVETEIDDYAVTDPAEFFAVVSEAFFETPGVLLRLWPRVHRQLELYYRQEKPSSFDGCA